MRSAIALVFMLPFLMGIPVRAAQSAKVPALGTSVEMPFLIAPLNDAQGRLTAYAYISSKIIASSPDSAVYIRSKTPFLQDAFVRDVNERNIKSEADSAKVDGSALAARLTADARKVVGSARMVSLQIVNIQIGSLRSSPPQG